jgi:hypothetical protein
MSRTSNQGTSTRATALAALGGLAAVLGGLLGAAAAYMESLAPEGSAGAYRVTEPVVAALAVVSLILAIIGLLGLAALARARGRSYWAAILVASLVVAGVASMTTFSVYLAGMVNESWGWWAFGITGFFALMLGFVLGGVHAFVTRVVPRWTAAVATVTSAAIFFFNTETAAVLFAVPAALAWALVGGFMLRETLGQLDIGHRHAPAVGA